MTCEAWQGCKKRDLSIQAWIQTQKHGKRERRHKHIAKQTHA